jgi:hypothetical protein
MVDRGNQVCYGLLAVNNLVRRGKCRNLNGLPRFAPLACWFLGEATFRSAPESGRWNQIQSPEPDTTRSGMFPHHMDA